MTNVSRVNVGFSCVIVLLALLVHRPMVELVQRAFGIDIGLLLVVIEAIGCGLVVWLLVGPVGLIMHRKEMRDLQARRP